MNKTKEEGITLIGLSITVIVLLILTGVVLNLTIGENGIFKIAKQVGEDYTDAQNKELNELDKLYSSILVAEDSKVTLTMQELNEYIDNKVEEKTQSKIEKLNNEINNLQTKNAELENLIQNVSDNKITYTYTELARTTSTTEVSVRLSESLSNYKYIVIAINIMGYNYYSGFVPIEHFKEKIEYFAVATGGVARWSCAKYQTDQYVYMGVGSPDGGTAILYGIK